jgi:hypothetical protein
VLASLSVLTSACSLPFANPSPTPTPNARPRSTATITIVQPPASSVVTTTTLTVQFQLTGGRIVAVTSKNLTPDTGHIHLSIDGHVLSMNYQPSATVSLQAFAPGPHSLQGEFVAIDHLPFNPRIIAREIIEYQPPGSS